MTPNTKALVIWLFAIGGFILLALMASNEPIKVSPLQTGRTCVEVANRLMADKQHAMTADEQSDMKQCAEP